MKLDRLPPQNLTAKRGFRSRKPDAMTNAEKQRQFRARAGNRILYATLPVEVAAAVLYLKKEWGMETNREVALAAIRFLALCTRQGLTKLPQTLD
jgi:hypothetical protein